MDKGKQKLQLGYKQAYQYLMSARHILLISHIKPDLDAIASLSAMSEFLNEKQKKFSSFCATPPSKDFLFLKHSEKIISDEGKLNWSEFDLIVVLDCGEAKRSGLADRLKNRPSSQKLIEIDHHPKMEDYADLELRDTSSAATVENIFNFFLANQLKISKDIANSLLAGLLGDTGNFLFPSASQKTLSMASQLLLAGANFPRTNRLSSCNKNIETLKLWGLVLNNLIINTKYKIAFSVLPLSNLEKFVKEEVEAFDAITNFLANLKGVKAVLFLREEKNGLIKGSLRSSHPKVDVSILARILGGGGHPKASGFSLEGRLEKSSLGFYSIKLKRGLKNEDLLDQSRLGL